MKKILLGMGFLVAALVVGLSMQPSVSTVRATGQETCPHTGDWVKVEDIDAQSYEYTAPEGKEIISSCYKASTTLRNATYNPAVGEVTLQTDVQSCGWTGPIWNLKWKCVLHDISHASFKLQPIPVVDVCENIDGVQEELPEGYYFSDEGVCSEKIYGCLDEVANNYNNEATHSDQSCTYDDQPYCYEDETILVPDNEEVPEGAVEGACIVPEPEQPKEEPKQSFSRPAPAKAPSCPDTAPVKEPANPHIYRNGDMAIVKWYPTEGGSAHIYYKEGTSTVWQHAVRDIENNGYFEINGLGNGDWDFAVQQANGCAAGPMSPVIIDGPAMGRLFLPTLGLYID